MNEVVHKFLEEQIKKNEVCAKNYKKTKNEEELKRRKEHLVKLGLVKDNEIKEYAPNDLLDWQKKERGYVYQDEKGFYKHVNNPEPIEVTDEEYFEICKVCPPNVVMTEIVDTKPESNSFAEIAITILGWVILIVGLGCCVTLMILAGTVYWDYNWAVAGLGMGVLIVATVSWGILLVLANISRKLDNMSK